MSTAPVNRASRKGPHVSVRPYAVKHAIKFNAEMHRRLPKLQGGMWAVAAFVEGEMVGVGIVGHPQARMADDGRTLELLRVAVRAGAQNACSAIYGAVAGAARSMGADVFTFIHADESGHSLKAAGWVEVAASEGGEWGRPSRPRQLAFDAKPKRKFAPAWTRFAPAPPPAQQPEGE